MASSMTSTCSELKSTVRLQCERDRVGCISIVTGLTDCDDKSNSVSNSMHAQSTLLRHPLANPRLLSNALAPSFTVHTPLSLMIEAGTCRSGVAR